MLIGFVTAEPQKNSHNYDLLQRKNTKQNQQRKKAHEQSLKETRHKLQESSPSGVT